MRRESLVGAQQLTRSGIPSPQGVRSGTPSPHRTVGSSGGRPRSDSIPKVVSPLRADNQFGPPLPIRSQTPAPQQAGPQSPASAKESFHDEFRRLRQQVITAALGNQANLDRAISWLRQLREARRINNREAYEKLVKKFGNDGVASNLDRMSKLAKMASDEIETAFQNIGDANLRSKLQSFLYRLGTARQQRDKPAYEEAEAEAKRILPADLYEKLITAEHVSLKSSYNLWDW